MGPFLLHWHDCPGVCAAQGRRGPAAAAGHLGRVSGSPRVTAPTVQTEARSLPDVTLTLGRVVVECQIRSEHAETTLQSPECIRLLFTV